MGMGDFFYFFLTDKLICQMSVYTVHMCLATVGKTGLIHHYYN